MNPNRTHPTVRRLGPACLALVSVLGLGACKGWHVETTPAAELVRERRPQVVRIDRSSDSTKVVMYSPTVVGDSIRGLPTELAIRPFFVPLQDVKTIAVRRFSLGKTLLLGLAVAGGVAVYQLLQSLNEGPSF